MKRIAFVALFTLLVLAAFQVQGVVHAQVNPSLTVTSHYFVNRYGFATANETVTFYNNSTLPISVPDIEVGLGSLGSSVVGTPVITPGYTVTETAGGYTVPGAGSILAAGSRESFTLSTLINRITSKSANDTLQVMILMGPSINLPVDRLVVSIALPSSTSFETPPEGFSVPASVSNETYSRAFAGPIVPSAFVSEFTVSTTSSSDFHPLLVYSASRTVSMGPDGNPVVTDAIYFKNNGTETLATLVIAPLIPSGGKVTIMPSVEPRLLGPYLATLTGYSLDLSNPRIGSYVGEGTESRITYRYPLPSSYYSVSGGVITVNLPNTPPINAFVNTYSILVSLPAGGRVVQGPPAGFSDVGPRQAGQTTVSYTLAVGWAVGDGLPAASLIFVLLLAGLFVSRTTLTEEEETEEESSTERASTMIKAFEEKTSMINGLWQEISGADPNDLDRAYFDEIRSRMDSFRGRALQRLNELKQKSTTQKFFDLLNQIHTTEREVDRAAKDTLNLYEQFYTRRMRKEVFDRLQPQYLRRLEKALNQLSDELHSVQKEAKLL
ncbi:MAG: hypothetical protein HY296_00215 [Thaumarchaeota archaeon]|nr:hypothetical protein [Nitrososphaerota archaeon]